MGKVIQRCSAEAFCLSYEKTNTSHHLLSGIFPSVIDSNGIIQVLVMLYLERVRLLHSLYKDKNLIKSQHQHRKIRIKLAASTPYVYRVICIKQRRGPIHKLQLSGK